MQNLMRYPTNGSHRQFFARRKLCQSRSFSVGGVLGQHGSSVDAPHGEEVSVRYVQSIGRTASSPPQLSSQRRRLLSQKYCIDSTRSQSRKLSTGVVYSSRSNELLLNHPINANENSMLNPFSPSSDLTQCEGKTFDRQEQNAFSDLFKAISMLPHQVDSVSSPLMNTEMKSSCNEKSESPDEVNPNVVDIFEEQLVDGAKTMGRCNELQKAASENNESTSSDTSHSSNEREKLIIEGISNKDYHSVLKLVEQAASHQQRIRNITIRPLIYFLARHDILVAYDMLKQHTKEENFIDLALYRKLVKEISYAKIDPVGAKTMVDELVTFIQNECSDDTKIIYQHILLPELAAALNCNNIRPINILAKPIIEFVIDRQFPILDPDLYESMLEKSSFENTKPTSFPYHRVIHALVSNGHLPKSDLLLKVLHNQFPYLDTKAVSMVLSSILEINSMSTSSTPNNSLSPAAQEYLIDMGTLESISLAAAKYADINLNLLVWDLVELFGYQPSESMYEDVILSFLKSKSPLKNVFGALSDMESRGFVPSHVLLFHMAREISRWDGRLAKAKEIISWQSETSSLTASRVNVVMLGYALRKDVVSVFEIFDDFFRQDVPPDANTFSYLMKALAMDTNERFSKGENSQKIIAPSDMEDIRAAMQTIFMYMDEAGFTEDKFFVNEHVKLLCALNEAEEAKLILEQAVAKNIAVMPGSIVQVASHLAHNGNFDVAHTVARMTREAGCGEAPTFLIKRIDKLAKEAAAQNLSIE